MSLWFKLQASIALLALMNLVALSVAFVYVTIDDSFDQAKNIAERSASQVDSHITNSAPALVAKMRPSPTSADELVAAYVAAVEQDANLTGLLQRHIVYSSAIVEGLVTGPGERIVAASFPHKRGQRHAPLPPLERFMDQGPLQRLNEVFSSNQDYELVRELGFQMEGGQRRVLTIRIILSSALLRDYVEPRLKPMVVLFILAALVSGLIAAWVAGVAVRPLQHIGEMIDGIAGGKREQSEAAITASREVAAVESKLSVLGERVRGARDDADKMRTNIDQLLARLEDAVFLFGRDGRLVMAGGAVDRLIEGGRRQIMGRSLEEAFPATTELGALVQGAVQSGRTSHNLQVEHHNRQGEPMMVLLSVEVLEEFPSRERIGSLVTLREAEPRRQIESQLDLATRLAAISRLTSGVAHEIKNPLAAIRTHLDLLKEKLAGEDVGAEQIEVMLRAIQRLDRVVVSFLDFTRPLELAFGDVNLPALLDEIAGLVRPDAAERNVRVELAGPSEAWTRGDRDMLHQAILNVVVNGIQAMEDGGELTIGLAPVGESWQISIRDTGCGIPLQDQEKIFKLYFTTKQKGSGIGLAMTFRVIQLHGGTIDLTSAPGEGTEFRLLLAVARHPGSEQLLPDAEDAAV